MNTKISIKTTSYIIVITIIILLFLSIFPLHLVNRPYTTKSQEKIESTIVIKPWYEYTITQLIGAEGNKLRSVELSIDYAEPNSLLDLQLLDAELNVLLTREVKVTDKEINRGWITFPIDYRLDRGASYYIRYRMPDVDRWLEPDRFSDMIGSLIVVNLEDHNTTTATANSYLTVESNSAEINVDYEWLDYNLIQRYNYSIYFNWWQGLILIIVAFIVLTTISWILVKNKSECEIDTIKLLRYMIYPILLISALVLMINIYPLKKFGDSVADILVWELSIGMSVIIIIAIIESKIGSFTKLFTLNYLRENIAHWIRIISIAMMLWYGFTYVNGLYNIHHEYAYRRILICFFVFLIATLTKEELFNRINAIWLIVGVISGITRYRLHIDDIERQELYRLETLVIVLGGIVIINIVVLVSRCLINKTGFTNKLNLIMAIPYIILLMGMKVMGNGREWPLFLAFFSFTMLLRLLFYKNYNLVVMEVCNGVILNFIIMVGFSLLHRPYYRYMRYRYALGFHTVTVTAIYLTMVIAAIMVRLFIRSGEYKDKKELIPDLSMLGISITYMLFTLSRTGYLSAIIMIIVTLVLISIVYDSKDYYISNSCKRIVACGLAVIVMFPITFTYTRLVPAIADDPVLYDYEYIEDYTINRGESKDSKLYMDLGRFINVFNSKVLGVGDTITDASDAIGYRGNAILAYINNNNLLLLSGIDPDDSGDSLEQFSNGRLTIFKSYIEQFNLSGHEDMGAVLPNGEIATHAHNTYLQAIYDHGYIVGIYFALFLIFIWIYSVLLLFRNKSSKQYLLLPVMLCGLMSTGLVEWVFHPCYPIAMATILLLIIAMVKGHKPA